MRLMREAVFKKGQMDWMAVKLQCSQTRHGWV